MTTAIHISGTRQFNAVCWDHDGVLVDTEYLFFEATREAFEQVGKELSCDDWCADYLAQGKSTASIAVERGLSQLEAEALAVGRNKRYKIKLTCSPPLRPGVEKTLQLIRDVPMALVTGSTREQLNLIHRERSILDYFSTIISREDYSKAKPDPEPYLKAAAALGIRPEHCLAVEDSGRGLASAIAAGMKCIVIPTKLTASQDFGLALGIEPTVCAIPRYL